MKIIKTIKEIIINILSFVLLFSLITTFNIVNGTNLKIDNDKINSKMKENKFTISNIFVFLSLFFTILAYVFP